MNFSDVFISNALVITAGTQINFSAVLITFTSFIIGVQCPIVMR